MTARLHIHAILVGMAMIISACAPDQTPQQGASRAGAPMIFFAVDGLDWSVMAPLLAEGRMPTMAGLMARGSYGYLKSMNPTYSAVIWTTIATAKTPEKHGIEHFIYQAKNGQYHYYTSGHRRTKAFWNILSDYGMTVHTIGWWMTYPAEQVNGTIVSQTNTTSVMRDPQRALWKGTLLKGVEGQVYPPEYQNHVMELLDATDNAMDSLTLSIFGPLPNPPSEFGQLMWDQTIWALRADAVYKDVARDILEHGEPFDLLAVYIGGPDVTGHRFWHYAYPEKFEHQPPPDQIENYGHVIDDYYAYVDQQLADLIDAAPANASVVVVSDHGMEPYNTEREFRAGDPPALTNSGHHYDAPPGVFIAAGEGFRRSTSTLEDPPRIDVDMLPTVGRVLDVMPTIYAVKGIPQARDFDGRPLVGVLDDDWLSQNHVEYVDTHDTKEWVSARGDRIRRAIDESERLDQLRSLGYIR